MRRKETTGKARRTVAGRGRPFAAESEKGAVMVSSTLVALYAAAGQGPSGLLSARQQMAFSLGRHILLVCFGVVLPVMIYVAHRRGITRDDAVALGLARQWGTAAAVLVAAGAISATVLGFEMGLLWPGLMGRYGDVLVLPLAFAGLSFFVEAVFLGLYLYGWGRIRPRRHLATLVPMGMAGAVGMFGVVAADAWTNDPSGFRLADGVVTEVNPWRVIGDEGVYPQFAHMCVGAFMVVGFVVAGVYAVGLLRGRRDDRHRLGFTMSFVFATVAALLQPFVGHMFGMYVRDEQTPRVVVPGREVVAVWARSPVDITHATFLTMVVVGVLLSVLVLVFWGLRWRGRDLSLERWFLWAVVAAGPFAVLALECGLLATEIARHPWAVWRVLSTRDAVSTSNVLWWSHIGVLLIHIALAVGAIVVLRSRARHRHIGGQTSTEPETPAPESETSAPEPEPDDRDQLVHSAGEG